MAAAKVVRVEEVAEAAERETSLLGDGLMYNSSSQLAKYTNARPAQLTDQDLCPYVNETDGADEEEDDEEELTEAMDKVGPLPEGWPRVPELLQGRQWEFSKAVSPKVNKATSHLELLQNIIEEWFKVVRSQAASRASSGQGRSRATTSNSVGGSTVGRRQMRFREELKDGVVPRSAVTTSTASATTQELSILGVGAGTALDQKRARVAEPADDGGVPYLGADEVLNEVIAVLARLETDRQDTLDTLHAERGRVTMLVTKIDQLSTQRMADLPVAVQKEHEACAMDISELNWHVSYRGRAMHRIQTKAQVAEALNVRLKEDIAFTSEHIPLVAEKLELELECMERIEQAQIDTNDELETTMDRCTKVEEKVDEAQDKAARERQTIKNDLDSVRSSLARISQELSEAKSTHNAYIHKCSDLRQQLEDNALELKVLEVKEVNIKAAEAMQHTKVNDMQEKIKDEEREHRKLEDENFRMVALSADKRSTYADHVEEMRKCIAQQKEEMRRLTRLNQELEMDVEDGTKKLVDCDRQKLADAKNLVRMEREQERTEEQYLLIKEDLANVSIINQAVKEQLQNAEEKCIQSEESLRSTAEALKRQVKDEIHAKTVISARINSDSGDLDQSKIESTQKKDLVQKKAEEVDGAVAGVLAKVKKLRTAHADKTKTVTTLKTKLAELANTRRKMKEDSDKKKEALSPHYKSLKDDLLTHSKKLDNIDWQTDMMTKKRHEMSESVRMMTRAMANSDKAIDKAQDDLAELNCKIQASQHIQKSMHQTLHQMKGRMQDQHRNHADHMKARREVQQQHQRDLDEHRKLNTELAAKYRRLQNTYVWDKNQMLNKVESRIKAEAAVKDMKQLQGLQKRMQMALHEYFKYRGLYNQDELGRMQTASNRNGVRVSKLQTDMDEAMETITSFLTGQLNTSNVRRIAMEKVEREERATDQGLVAEASISHSSSSRAPATASVAS